MSEVLTYFPLLKGHFVTLFSHNFRFQPEDTIYIHNLPPNPKFNELVSFWLIKGLILFTQSYQNYFNGIHT